MKNITLMGKVFSQIGLFVVSGLLAGILLLAIQANKLPGIKQDIQQVPQNDDDVSPGDNNSSFEKNTQFEISSFATKDDDSVDSGKAHTSLYSSEEASNLSILNKSYKDSISRTSDTSIQSIPTNTQKLSNKSQSSNTSIHSNISETSIISKTSNKTSSPVTQTSISQLPTTQKLSVSAACGVSPLFFAGHNFANVFFQDSSVIFSPVSTVGLTIPQKSNFTYSIYLTASSSSLNLKSPQLYDSINLNFKTNFILTKIDFSIMHKIFSEKNLAEIHLGTGLLFFNNPSCIINQVSYNKNNTVYYALDFGFSLKHFFSERFFTAAVCDFTLVLPNTEQLFIIQPALIAGLNF